MSSYEDTYLNRRPQELCKMCGRCCRVVNTSISYEDLKRLEAEGDTGAKDFLKIFVPYPSIEAARKVDAEIVDNILAKTDVNRMPEDKICFYYCKYILDDNRCSIYEERPALCKHCPSTPWSIVPPGCGFEGWLFMERENIKEKIRKAKEELLELQILKKKRSDKALLRKIEAVEHKIQTNISMYERYGSKDW